MPPPPTIPLILAPPKNERKEKLKPKSKMKGKGKETRRNRKRKRGNDEVYKDIHDLTAEHLVQQAWAQAVRVDGTIIVLHSGNHELVCLRHRDTQTLYVSDLIEPSTCKDPGYGKLQVSVYVAAAQDMIDRTKERLHKSQPKSSEGDDDDDPAGSDNDKGDRDDDWGSGSGHKGDQGHSKGSREGGNSSGGEPNANESGTIEKTIQVASKRDLLFLYFQYGVYGSPIPASFIRSAPPIMAKAEPPAPPWSPRAIDTYTLNGYLLVVLTSEIGQGATGIVHRGTLKLGNMDGSVPLDVVVKLAFDSRQQDMFRSEYETYHHLWSKGVLRGITTTLGFFKDNEDGPCTVVMLYADDSLVDMLEQVLSVSDCRSALSTLESIHCTGILQGDIRQESILVSDSGVTIIDFSHSKQCDDQEAMDKEHARLRFVLGCE